LESANPAETRISKSAATLAAMDDAGQSDRTVKPRQHLVIKAFRGQALDEARPLGGRTDQTQVAGIAAPQHGLADLLIEGMAVGHD
jgi:hypothetical protein